MDININDITKFKIVDVLKDKEDLTIFRRFLRADDNQCFECPLMEFSQTVSIGKKYIEQVNYNVISRVLEILFSSIGHGVEKYIIESAHKHSARLTDFDGVYYASLIASPELLEDKIKRSTPVLGFYDFGITNDNNVNYLLKENQFINHNSEWMYSVSGDVIEAFEEEDKYLIKGTVVLGMTRIHIQEVGQMSEGIG